MTLPVAAVSAVTAAAPATSVAAPSAMPASHGAAFDNVLGSVDSLQQLQSTTSDLAVQAATGSLENVHDYTIAAAESSLAIELTAAVRNKAVEAFTEIMRMQA
ncbi:flagellar hook-basal body complex protein FliE [Cellulomonas edaphi]|uniref:Flagellar hook-basal body complex protein FliE n=1 Tax=Cellulomonas edaphi TaxID=3053468 RepID=A0ABT7S663_9CELL|nr:flagellar hook-basal body complex protein FliE [Cellulomons edaphi]MDM7830542.1 flagellar hook-basal body complex protein FliE [Cellulomons edaphi]